MSKEPNKGKETKNVKAKRHFFKDFRAELKKVIWPTPKQLTNSTVAVITIVLITTLIVFVLDLAFTKMNEYGVDKLRAYVESTVDDENTKSDITENTDLEGTNTEENAQTNTAEEDQNKNNEQENAEQNNPQE